MPILQKRKKKEKRGKRVQRRRFTFTFNFLHCRFSSKIRSKGRRGGAKRNGAQVYSLLRQLADEHLPQKVLSHPLTKEEGGTRHRNHPAAE